MEQLHKLLAYLESIIDLEHYNNAIEHQKKTMRFEENGGLCVRITYPNTEFKPFTMEETHSDMAKMMYNELLANICTFELKDSSLAMIRTNYGVGTLPSAFGAESFIVNGNMPWVKHLSKDEIKAVIAKGVPDYKTGFGHKVIETYEFYREMLSKYPKCNEAIRLFHPDFQGPLDVAHLLWGSDIYMDMYDEPDLVHDLMKLVTETYIDRMKKVKPYLNDEIDGFNFHWSHLFPGNIVLRNDSAVNLSSDMYKEFSMQYDDMIYDVFGKASMHFCGRADQWIFDMARSENILGLNLGNMPNVVFGKEYLDFLKPEVFDKNKPIISYGLTIEDFETMDFEKYHTGISYHIPANSRKEAEELLARCK